MYVFNRTLRQLDHTMHYSVVTTDEGWELREERDSRLVRQAHFQDWHRVERATRVITIQVDDLRTKGWADVA